MPPMPQTGPTLMQYRVLDRIATVTKTRGYPPTLAELAADLGFASRSSVAHHVSRLASFGLLSKEPSRARSIVVTERPVPTAVPDAPGEVGHRAVEPAGGQVGPRSVPALRLVGADEGMRDGVSLDPSPGVEAWAGPCSSAESPSGANAMLWV